jgi:hypothetical protein
MRTAVRHLVLHSRGMPTKHARIAITRDPEVDRALTAAANVLGPSKPEATLARELVLRGATAVIKEARGDIDPELDRYLDERGDVIRATMSRQERNALVRELLSQPVPPGPPMSEILDELREDRV